MAEYEKDIRIVENIQPRPLTSRQRTGRVFFVDTFENYYEAITEKWRQSYGTISLDTDYPKDGMSCMKLLTGSSEDNLGVAKLYYGAFPKSRFGLEFDFMTTQEIANIDKILISIYYYDGANAYNGYFYYLGEANLKWQYRNTSDVFTDITSGSQKFYRTYTTYQNVKIILDFVTYKYVKLICNEQEWDLSAISLYTEADTSTEPHMDITIGLQNAVSTASRELYVDNVILTDKEP